MSVASSVARSSAPSSVRSAGTRSPISSRTSVSADDLGGGNLEGRARRGERGRSGSRSDGAPAARARRGIPERMPSSALRATTRRMTVASTRLAEQPATTATPMSTSTSGLASWRWRIRSAGRVVPRAISLGPSSARRRAASEEVSPSPDAGEAGMTAMRAMYRPGDEAEWITCRPPARARPNPSASLRSRFTIPSGGWTQYGGRSHLERTCHEPQW